MLQQVISNLWIRYYLEAFFEFSISCLVGRILYTKIVDEPNTNDKIAKLSATFFLGVTISFSLIVTYVVVCAGLKLSIQEENKVE